MDRETQGERGAGEQTKGSVSSLAHADDVEPVGCRGMHAWGGEKTVERGSAYGSTHGSLFTGFPSTGHTVQPTSLTAHGSIRRRFSGPPECGGYGHVGSSSGPVGHLHAHIPSPPLATTGNQHWCNEHVAKSVRCHERATCVCSNTCNECVCPVASLERAPGPRSLVSSSAWVP